MYEDIIGLERPQYGDLSPMPMSDRAAQFSPFAALVGYGEFIPLQVTTVGIKKFSDKHCKTGTASYFLQYYRYIP